MNVFKELYHYRELLKANVKKEIRGKYKGSFLGVLWSFVNPLLQVLVFVIVFPYIMRIKMENYVIFLICGIIPWTWFITSITQATSCISINANLIKKVYFPRSILPISVVTSGMINFIISCIIIIIAVIVSGLGLSWHLIFLPIIIIIQYVVCLALAFLLSAINVFIKDIEYLVAFALNMMFYATPILYSIDLFNNGWMVWLFRLNPMAHLINAYRDIFYVHHIPNLVNLAVVFAISLVLLFICYKIFDKLQKQFAEEI